VRCRRLILPVASYATLGFFSVSLVAYRTIISDTFAALIEAPLYIVAALALTWLLWWPEYAIYRRFRRILGWSWPKAIGWKFNANTFFMAIPALRPIGLALIFANLPLIVTIEEVIFRLNTATWPEGILRSVTFGLVHFALGMPTLALLEATSAGILFTALYFRGGLEAAILLHLAIDIVLLLPILIVLVFDKLIPERVLPRTARRVLRQMTLGHHENEP